MSIVDCVLNRSAMVVVPAMLNVTRASRARIIIDWMTSVIMTALKPARSI